MLKFNLWKSWEFDSFFSFVKHHIVPIGEPTTLKTLLGHLVNQLQQKFNIKFYSIEICHSWPATKQFTIRLILTFLNYPNWHSFSFVTLLCFRLDSDQCCLLSKLLVAEITSSYQLFRHSLFQTVEAPRSETIFWNKSNCCGTTLSTSISH